ncbi:MAG: sigma-70 family RNA polymerase sigma factor [Bacteroidales bacterium]
MADNSKYSTDYKLLAGLQSGDREAYKLLVEKYHVKVIRTCTGFVHSAADAEDIAQEVFIEVFRSVDRFRGDSALSTWIYRIAVNKSLNFLRSAARRKVFSFLTGHDDRNSTASIQEPASQESNPEEALMRGDQARTLEKALASLPGKQRTAFVLNKYEDLAYKEISEIMDISIGSVESLIFRAKQNLQKRLYDFYNKNMR